MVDVSKKWMAPVPEPAPDTERRNEIPSNSSFPVVGDEIAIGSADGCSITTSFILLPGRFEKHNIIITNKRILVSITALGSISSVVNEIGSGRIPEPTELFGYRNYWFTEPPKEYSKLQDLNTEYVTNNFKIRNVAYAEDSIFGPSMRVDYNIFFLLFSVYIHHQDAKRLVEIAKGVFS